MVPLTPAIEVERLSRRFGSVLALDDVSFAVPRGAIFGFLGPNGSGKTTAIRLLLGLLEPSGGRARVLGYDPLAEGDAVRARSGALLEHPGLYERLSAADNLDFFGRVWNIPAPERQARIRDLLEHIGLWERRDEPVGDWSRGMKQKVAVARALFHRPAIAFLDEPTAGLDPVAAAALRDDLSALARRDGVTVFLTTHNLPEAERLCDRIGVIRYGKLLAVDTPAGLRLQAGGRQVAIRGDGLTQEVAAQVARLPAAGDVQLEGDRLLVRLSGDASSAPIVRLLVEAGVAVEEVHKGAASLEDAFLTLMEAAS